AALIRLEDIHKAYKTPVLRGVSLDVPEGCIYALIGPGASGKSVLLKIVAGLVVPERGRVFLGDDEVTNQDELRLAELRKRIGMLFQNYALFDRSVKENIAFPLRRLDASISEAEIAERVAERLQRVALPGTEER